MVSASPVLGIKPMVEPHTKSYVEMDLALLLLPKLVEDKKRKLHGHSVFLSLHGTLELRTGKEKYIHCRTLYFLIPH